MDRYFFILGRNTSLSLAEIFSILKRMGRDHELQDFSSEIAVFLLPTDTFVAQEFIDEAGGVIKIGRIMDETGLDEKEDSFEKIISGENLLSKYFPKNLSKIHFGLSLYNMGGEQKDLLLLDKKMEDVTFMMKQNLGEMGLKAGYVRVKERNLSSVSVAKNRLISHGAEIVMILGGNKLLVGKTAAIQDFAGFGFRDYYRPGKDKKSGIMPPKLARMMINLGSVSRDATLLDPFCGSGTIVTEAITLGYKNIIGSDISDRAIFDTRRNLDFLFNSFKPFRQNFPADKKNTEIIRTGNQPQRMEGKGYERDRFQIKTVQQDARNLSKAVEKNSIDLVVTEPYLGPAIFRKPDQKTIRNIFNQLKPLYLESFRQFYQLLKTGGKIIIVFPAFDLGGKIFHFEILRDIIRTGFKKNELIPGDFGVKLPEYTPRGTIIYGSRWHNVHREIISFSRL